MAKLNGFIRGRDDMSRPLPMAESRRVTKTTAAPDCGPLIDTFGRVHNNLRISVTDRCNLRCTYCMPEDVEFLNRAEILSFEEIVRFARVAARLGIDKVRLTGGEPLMRRDLSSLVRQLSQIETIKDIGLTTNGLLLAQAAADLKRSGLHRLNISLDTLDEQRFRTIARRDGLPDVLNGIEQARIVGFTSIKINAVILRGVNDHDIVPLAQFASDRDIEIRYIEAMPIGAEPWDREKAVLAHEILNRLTEEFGRISPVGDGDARNPATEYRSDDGRLRVGMIASVSQPFCMSCNRLRLTADGKLRHCLFALEETDVKPLLRGTSTDRDIENAVRQTIWSKWEGHEINSARFIKPSRTMHAIGG